MTRPRVLILGGGYVAITLTRGLRRAIERGLVDVTVVSRENFHAFHGFVGEMVTGRVAPGNILSPVRRIFPPAAVHVAEIDAIDLDAQRVTTSRHLDGARFELPYDELVLALGTVQNTDAYPGLAEHAFKLKTFADCFALKNHLLEMFELAEIEPSEEERRRLLTFFVAGGGFSGTELAGELAEFMRLVLKREYRGLSRDECRVVLVHPGQTILPELQSGDGPNARPLDSLVAYARRHMDSLGVEVLTETRVASATPEEVVLSNGDRVPTRTIVSAVGTRPSPLLAALGLPQDERGRVVVDETLRVQGHEHVWAGGDCASVPHVLGGTCPSVGIYALKHGGHIAKNIDRSIAGRSPRPFRYRGLGQGVSIGKRTAVGEVKGVRLRGLPAWLAWRALLVYYFPTWDRRLRLLADWLIWPLVGRDIVWMTRDDRDLRDHLYQPGQLIAERRRPVKHIHVIVEGEVELVGLGRTLGPGDHFGRLWIESVGVDELRARSLVRTVALRADQAHRLRDILHSTGKLARDEESLAREAARRSG
ncbi:MAG TPA: FAD-dependent oxidoreductase [Gaiellaceae bacterium]|nr:FAD-dependent oxidoreductase [Gaiellaceae bacterium]